jgi:hypothetical protein
MYESPILFMLTWIKPVPVSLRGNQRRRAGVGNRHDCSGFSHVKQPRKLDAASANWKPTGEQPAANLAWILRHVGPRSNGRPPGEPYYHPKTAGAGRGRRGACSFDLPSLWLPGYASRLAPGT